MIFTQGDTDRIAEFKAQIEVITKEDGYRSPSVISELRNGIQSLNRQKEEIEYRIQRLKRTLAGESGTITPEAQTEFEIRVSEERSKIQNISQEIENVRTQITAAEACQKRIEDLQMEALPYEAIQEIQRDVIKKGDFGKFLRIDQVLQDRVPEITKDVAGPFLKLIVGTFGEVLLGLDSELNKVAEVRAKGFGRMFKALKEEGFNDDQAMAIILAGIKPTTMVEQIASAKSGVKK